MIQKEYNIETFEIKSLEDVDYQIDEYGTRTVTKYFPDGVTPKEHYYTLTQKDLPEGSSYYKMFPSKKPNSLIFRDSIDLQNCSAFLSRNPDMSIDSYYLQIMRIENHTKLPPKTQDHFNQLKDDSIKNYTGFYIKYDTDFNPVMLYYWIEKPYIIDFLTTLEGIKGFDIISKLENAENIDNVKYIIFADKESYSSLYVSNKREWM